MKTQLQATLDVVKGLGKIGLDLIDSLNAHNEGVKKCVRLQNVTYISPKREEILGNVRYCGGV
jgi:hypothetical protein